MYRIILNDVVPQFFTVYARIHVENIGNNKID